jgi:ubiquinone/menaquinone biosynthesis C-methylase UbiE
VEDSPWKARQIIEIMRTNEIEPTCICEVGCGAGELLNCLHQQLPENIVFHGYEISPQAFELCQDKKNDKVHFYLKDLLEDESAFFDLVLCIDVLEHVEDYFGFLRRLRKKGKYKIFHIPLELTLRRILSSTRIMTVRESYGHIHYFTKETALASLKDTSYNIIDHFYTPAAIDLADRGFKPWLLKAPRKWMFSLNKDLTVRTLGGYSLIILAT